jgi:cell division protein FtsW
MIVLALLTFGFVMLASTCPAYAFNGDSFFFAKRQALWIGIGLAACGVMACLDYRLLRKSAGPLFLGAVVLLILVLFFGRRVNGAMRWFVLGPVRFQPSEFGKYALVVALAWWLEKMQRPSKGQWVPRTQHWWWGIFAPLLMAAVPAALIYREPDLGTALLFGAVTLAMLWVAGSNGRWLGGLMGLGAAGLVAFLVAIFELGMFSDSYQVQRILHWWWEDDLQGINYQQWVAKVAFGAGGVLGRGLGDSIMKQGYLPEAHTDFIFPIAGEELGLVTTLSVVAGFCVLVVGGLALVKRAPDVFGFLLGSGILAVIGLQAIINIAVVTDSLPNKGMALPFVSYGGSNLVMTLAACGVLWNICGQAQAHAAATAPETPGRGPRRGWRSVNRRRSNPFAKQPA